MLFTFISMAPTVDRTSLVFSGLKLRKRKSSDSQRWFESKREICVKKKLVQKPRLVLKCVDPEPNICITGSFCGS